LQVRIGRKTRGVREKSRSTTSVRNKEEEDSRGRGERSTRNKVQYKPRNNRGRKCAKWGKTFRVTTERAHRPR